MVKVIFGDLNPFLTFYFWLLRLLLMMDDDKGGMQTTLAQRVPFYARGFKATVLPRVHLQGRDPDFHTKQPEGS